jgi:hypothetical protein
MRGEYKEITLIEEKIYERVFGFNILIL